MSRARRRRPDVRSAVRHAASRRSVGAGAGRRAAGGPGESSKPGEAAPPTGSVPRTSRLAFLLEGVPAVPAVAPAAAPGLAAAPATGPESAPAATRPGAPKAATRLSAPIRVRSAPETDKGTSTGKGKGVEIATSRPAAVSRDETGPGNLNHAAEPPPGTAARKLERKGPVPVWSARPAPHYRGDADERTAALVADPEDAWSGLPSSLQTVFGMAIALPLAAAVALTRLAAGFAGVRPG